MAVLDKVMSTEEVDYVRNIITGRDEYKQLMAESRDTPAATRYLQPLCENEAKESGCEIWDDSFLELVANELILEVREGERARRRNTGVVRRRSLWYPLPRTESPQILIVFLFVLLPVPSLLTFGLHPHRASARF